MWAKSSPRVREAVKNELNKEQLHDISLLLDAIADVVNVAEIVEIITSAPAVRI